MDFPLTGASGFNVLRMFCEKEEVLLFSKKVPSITLEPMMKQATGILVLGSCLILIGCGPETITTPHPNPPSKRYKPRFAPTSDKPVKIDEGVAKLDERNTRIQFIGIKKTNRDWHKGGFDTLSGEIKVNKANQVTGLWLEIDLNSTFTDADYSDEKSLAKHLKSPDFFDVKQYPKARFEATRLEPIEMVEGDSGDNLEIAGTLDFHGKTQEITIQAKVNIEDGAITLASGFNLQRSAYGIKYGLDKIEDAVMIQINVGTALPNDGPMGDPAVPGGGRPGGGRPGGGRPGVSAEERFKQSDKNEDGKLTGDEISERLKESLADIDKDKDGAISLKEYTEWRANNPRRPGGGRPGGGPGRPGGGRPPRPMGADN